MKKLLISLFLFGAILTPSVQLVPGLPTLRPEMIVVLLAIVTGKVALLRNDPINKIFVILFIIASIAIGSSYLVFETPYDSRDLMILPMLVQYWLVYCFAISVVYLHDLKLFAVKTIALFVTVSALVGIFQKFNLMGVNDWLTPLYLMDEHGLNQLRELSYWGRATGTVGDPRHYACVLAVGIAAIMALLFQIKKTGQLWYIVMLLTCLAAVLLTASRTGLAAVVLVLFIGLYLSRTSSSRLISYLMLFGMFLPMFFILYLGFVPQGTKDRLFQTGEVSFQRSLAGRERDTMEPFIKAMTHPMILIIGRGPAKAILPGSEHSDIGWMTLHYGLPGLACYLAIFYRTYRMGMRNFKRNAIQEERVFAMFTLMLLGDWAMFALAESIFKLNQLMSINLFVVGVVFATLFGTRKVKNRIPSQLPNRQFFSSAKPFEMGNRTES